MAKEKKYYHRVEYNQDGKVLAEAFYHCTEDTIKYLCPTKYQSYTEIDKEIFDSTEHIKKVVEED